MYIGPGSDETWNVEKYPDNPEGIWNELAEQVTNVYFAQKHHFPERRIEVMR